ncbi:His-Xaa-Ser system radical SAM maturase HxsB [Cupriavidus consociatus]|uniref:His-Xaa-Ser system radical SAM maturase HxsB n=1 Tax=Cupriavidus consociatus TaxID=2821357 RepID=UPI001AE5AC4D|nr:MULTISPECIES: His-Xaa-Ser system radical SAM maturase HxsB [unclassified Cupriavidus]MBP0624735.1 His-Xaa-Ser system radical SAM maturase HxsB [Cupriavidus sp. LEh25]MDK2661449.1 His-Xaa-Ser system radical SAM maturase HxsB [Cupriavidus sp. LEh21]
MSKFLPLEGFLDSSGTYHLLPFRFEPLNAEEVVLTNAVGEFTFLSREKLDDLVGHRLKPTDSDYVALRSRHFISEEGDEASLELLALKTRTKFNKLANFTNLHLFVVSLRCDHSCQYCQVSRQSEDKGAFDMTRETADKALGLVFQSPNPAIKIEFQGGEPLLNFDLIRYVVDKAERRGQAEGRDLEFVITTTLALATDEILEYCRDHHIYLSSSLDGPEDLHNKNRPRPGRDSHARFVAGLQRARDIVGYDSVSALMTTSPASLNRVRDIIDEYVKHGLSGIFLRHLSPYGFAMKTKSFQAYNAERWLQFYKEGLDYILELNKAGLPFTEYYSSLILTKMLTSNDPGFVDLMNPAGAGIAAVVFNYDGDVYASDESRMLREMGDTTFRLGNVHENTYEQIFTNDALLNALEDSFTGSAPMCSDCAFEPWCGAEPVFHHAMYGDVLGRKPESEFCKRMMGVTKHLLDIMRRDAEAKEIFMRWVNRC